MKLSINDLNLEELLSDELLDGEELYDAEAEFEDFMQTVIEDDLIRTGSKNNNFKDLVSIIYAYAEAIYGKMAIDNSNPYRGYIIIDLLDKYIVSHLAKIRIEALSEIIEALYPDYVLIRNYLNRLILTYLSDDKKFSAKDRTRFTNAITKLVRVVIQNYQSSVYIMNSYGSTLTTRIENALGCGEMENDEPVPKFDTHMIVGYDKELIPINTKQFNIYTTLIRGLLDNAVWYHDLPLTTPVLYDWWNILKDVYGDHAAAEIMLTLVLSCRIPVLEEFVRDVIRGIGDDYRALIPTSQQFYKPHTGNLVMTIVEFNEVSQLEGGTLHWLYDFCYRYETFGVFRVASFDKFIEEINNFKKQLKPQPGFVVERSLLAREFATFGLSGRPLALGQSDPYNYRIRW